MSSLCATSARFLCSPALWTSSSTSGSALCSLSHEVPGMRAADKARPRPHKKRTQTPLWAKVLTLGPSHTTVHSLNNLLSGDGCDLGVSVVKGQLTAWSCASPNTESTLLWHLTLTGSKLVCPAGKLAGTDKKLSASIEQDVRNTRSCCVTAQAVPWALALHAERLRPLVHCLVAHTPSSYVRLCPASPRLLHHCPPRRWVR